MEAKVQAKQERHRCRFFLGNVKKSWVSSLKGVLLGVGGGGGFGMILCI